MNRESVLLWKVARENIKDLPPCPDDISEPAYVGLMFCAFCKVSSLVSYSCVLSDNAVLRIVVGLNVMKYIGMSEPASAMTAWSKTSIYVFVKRNSVMADVRYLCGNESLISG
jgi:hypothetical protein